MEEDVEKLEQEKSKANHEKNRNEQKQTKLDALITELQ